MGFPRQEYWSGLPFPSPGLRMYRILYKFKSKKSKKIQSVSGQKNRTLHQRKHINGKYAHENLFNNTSHLFIVQSLSHAWLLAIPWTAAWQPCLSFTIFFRACSNSCPLSQWCHPTISSSVAPFSSCLLSFPASGSFPVSQFFASGSQSIGASASASAFPVNIQGWVPLGWTGSPLGVIGFLCLASVEHDVLRPQHGWTSKHHAQNRSQSECHTLCDSIDTRGPEEAGP